MDINKFVYPRQQFKVEPSATNEYYKSANTHNFCADLTIDGNNYKGYGTTLLEFYIIYINKEMSRKQMPNCLLRLVSNKIS